MQRGIRSGVYLDWPSAQKQIQGFTGPKYKKFNSRAEAEAFVAVGKQHKGGLDTGANNSPPEDIRQMIVKKSAPGLQTNGTYIPKDKNGDPYDIGTGPLPPGAEDGFDPNIRLDQFGKLVYKTEEEKVKTKVMPREKDPPGMLRIYTDGSSLTNGQAGARAGVGVYFGPQDPKYDLPNSTLPDSPPLTPTPPRTQTVYAMDWAARARLLRNHDRDDEQDKDTADEGTGPRLTSWRYRNISEALKGSKQTNQRAELTAIQRALDIAPKHRDVTIFTDSKYSIDCVTNWYRGWERNGWTNSKGKPVENVDLVKGVRAAIAERELMQKKTLFVWVKGHQGNQGNVEADRLAVAGSRMARNVSENESEGGGQHLGGIPGLEDDLDSQNGFPRANGVEDEDVKQAFEEMAASMDQDGKAEWNAFF